MRQLRILAAIAMLAFVAPTAKGEMFSKNYAFKPNTVLEVGTALDAGLRLDSIQFLLEADDRSGPANPRVRVTISNLGEKSVRVGISVAASDDADRLVGAVSGGTKLFPLRAGRQMPYVLDIDGANSEMSKATTFRISIEAK